MKVPALHDCLRIGMRVPWRCMHCLRVCIADLQRLKEKKISTNELNVLFGTYLTQALPRANVKNSVSK